MVRVGCAAGAGKVGKTGSEDYGKDRDNYDNEREGNDMGQKQEIERRGGKQEHPVWSRR